MFIREFSNFANELSLSWQERLNLDFILTSHVSTQQPPGKHLYRLVPPTGSASRPAVAHNAWRRPQSVAMQEEKTCQISSSSTNFNKGCRSLILGLDVSAATAHEILPHTQ